MRKHASSSLFVQTTRSTPRRGSRGAVPWALWSGRGSPGAVFACFPRSEAPPDCTGAQAFPGISGSYGISLLLAFSPEGPRWPISMPQNGRRRMSIVLKTRADLVKTAFLPRDCSPSESAVVQMIFRLAATTGETEHLACVRNQGTVSHSQPRVLSRHDAGGIFNHFQDRVLHHKVASILNGKASPYVDGLIQECSNIADCVVQRELLPQTPDAACPDGVWMLSGNGIPEGQLKAVPPRCAHRHIT